jgi:magnesium-transporting ATPase (P-type)
MQGLWYGVVKQQPWSRLPGARTKFGRTAELVRIAHVVSTQQKAVLRIVRNLAIFSGVLILAMGVYAYTHAMPWNGMVPPLFTSVLAAIPVALPATFTLAAAVGARSLAKLAYCQRGFLPWTRQRRSMSYARIKPELSPSMRFQ